MIFLKACFCSLIIFVNYATQDKPSNARNLMKIDNVGLADEFRGSFNSALKIYFQELYTDPNFSKIRFYKGEELHSWQGLPETAKWQGEFLKNKKIYVDAFKTCELDDTFLFLRFLPLLNSEGAEVYLKLHPEMHKLFNESELKAKIIKDDLEIKNLKFDYYTSLLSIPHCWQVDLGFAQGYSLRVNVNNAKSEEFKKKYFDNSKFKIGVVCDCDPKHRDFKNHSISLNEFEKIAKLENVKLYALQTDINRSQHLGVFASWLEDISLENKSLTDLVAIINNLDMVITVDGIVPHLSAMLGKTTWLLLPELTEWKWFCYAEKESSIWYPNLHKFSTRVMHNNDYLMLLLKKLVEKKSL
jgi:hypothetical protein